MLTNYHAAETISPLQKVFQNLKRCHCCLCLNLLIQPSFLYLLCLETKATWLHFYKKASPVLERLVKAKLRPFLPTFNQNEGRPFISKTASTPCHSGSIRTERKHLLSLYEGPSQILRYTVDYFESFDQCAEFLIGIAERCAAGHVQADDLQRERDAQVVARGIAAPSRHKKFAANQVPSSSQQKRKHEDICMDMCDWMSGPPMEEDAWF